MDVDSRSDIGPMSSNTANAYMSSNNLTYTEVIQEENVNNLATNSGAATSSNAATLRLRLTKKPSKNDRRVSWTPDTVDNEFMNKKKSKCCCIYSKPRAFDQSSSEDENEDKECSHCKGHRKSDYNSRRDPKDANNQNSDESSDEELHGENNNNNHHHHHHAFRQQRHGSHCGHSH